MPSGAAQCEHGIESTVVGGLGPGPIEPAGDADDIELDEVLEFDAASKAADSQATVVMYPDLPRNRPVIDSEIIRAMEDAWTEMGGSAFGERQSVAGLTEMSPSSSL